MSEENFETWAIVEIMGHSRFAGQVSEQTIGGASLIRLDVPAIDGQPAFSKLFGPSSIFCITPCDEATATKAAERFQSRPLELFTFIETGPRRLEHADAYNDY